MQIYIYIFLKVLIEDSFGEPAREREVDKISTKLPEARTTKSFDTFELVAKKTSVSKLMVIITPLKTVCLTINEVAYEFV